MPAFGGSSEQQAEDIVLLNQHEAAFTGEEATCSGDQQAEAPEIG